MITLNPRRPLDDDFPHRYMESDIDYLLNNRELAVILLNNHPNMVDALKALATDTSALASAVVRQAIPKELV